MGLLKDLNAGKVQHPFQTYIIEHGIERVRVKVPLAKIGDFEQNVADAIGRGVCSKERLLHIVTVHGGTEMRG